MSDTAKVRSFQRGTEPAAIRDTSSQDVQRDGTGRGRRRWTILVLALLLIAAVGAALYPKWKNWSGAGLAVPRERLRFATVTRGGFVRDVAAQGTVVAAISPSVFASNDGTVTLSTKAGDLVRAGDVLGVIDSPQLSSDLAQEQATLDSLETNLRRQAIENKKAELQDQRTVDLARVALVAAERELRRAEISWKQRVISLQDFEKATDDLETARVEHVHAKQAASLERESLDFELQTLRLQRDRQRLMVSNLERRVGELQILAPVDGMVGTIAVDQKAAVTANTALLTVVDLSAYEIEIRIPESYSDDLAIGMDASITFNGNQYAGTLSAVSPEVQNNSVTGRVRFSGNTPTGLRQNQRVSARIVLEAKENALLLRRGPFLDSGGGRTIYLARGDLAYRTAIQIGSIGISDVEVLDGLSEGDEVILSDINQFNGKDTVLLSD